MKKTVVLECLAVTGVVATGVLSARATLKATAVLAELEEKPSEEKTRVEKFKKVAPCYILPTGVGLATILSIACLSKEYKTTIAGMTASLAIANKVISHYESIASDALNHEPRLEMDPPIQKEILYPDLPSHTCNKKPIFNTGRGKELFHDHVTDTWFYSSEMDIMSAAYHINRNFALGLDPCVNYWCHWLGIPEIGPDGENVGWSCDYICEDAGAFWIDITTFHSKLPDGTPYQEIVFDYDAVEAEEPDHFSAWRTIERMYE